MKTAGYLFLGVGSHAVAVDRSTGQEVWRRKLKSSAFVTLSFDGRHLFAGAGGEVFCLHPATGELRWRNKLKGLGTGVVSFGGSTEAGLAGVMAAQSAATVAATAAVAG